MKKVDDAKIRDLVAECIKKLDETVFNEDIGRRNLSIVPFSKKEREGGYLGVLSNKSKSIFAPIYFDSHLKNNDPSNIRTYMRTMVDTGSTYNIISLSVLKKLHPTGIIAKFDDSKKAPVLLLGDGVSTVNVMGKIMLEFTFRNAEGKFVKVSDPFYVNKR